MKTKSDQILNARVALLNQMVISLVNLLAKATDRTVYTIILESLRSYVDLVEKELPLNDPTVLELRKALVQIQGNFEL